MAALPNGSSVDLTGNPALPIRLRPFCKIRSIDLRGTDIDDRQLIELIPKIELMRSLETIDVSGLDLRRSTIDRLRKLDRLRTINFSTADDLDAPRIPTTTRTSKAPTTSQPTEDTEN